MKKLVCLGIIVMFLMMVGSVRFVYAAEQNVKVSQQLLNVNTATVEALESLPGVGPVTAQRIIDYRTEHGALTSVEQLVDIKGIGDKSLEKLRPFVSVK